MSITEYLSASPLTDLVKYHAGQKADAIPFPGTLRKHPYDQGKCLLFAEGSKGDPSIIEFRIADVVAVDELPSPVTETGAALNMVRLWIARGSVAIRYEPFEVGSTHHPQSEREANPVEHRNHQSSIPHTR